MNPPTKPMTITGGIVRVTVTGTDCARPAWASARAAPREKIEVRNCSSQRRVRGWGNPRLGHGSGSLCKAARYPRHRRCGLQLVYLCQYVFPVILVFFRVDRSRGVGIEVENVGAQLRRRPIELPARQPSQQLCISVVGERVLRWLGRLTTIKITIGKHQCIRAHFFEEGPVLIDGQIDALEIQVLGLRRRVLETQSLEWADSRHVAQEG